MERQARRTRRELRPATHTALDDLSHVVVLALTLRKQDVLRGEVRPAPVAPPPFGQSLVWRLRDDEGVQRHVVGRRALPHRSRQLAQTLVQADLVAVLGGVLLTHPVRLHEHNPLGTDRLHPENEVGVEPALLEEAHARAPALIPQQEHLRVVRAVVPFLVPVLLQVVDESLLASGQTRRRHLQRRAVLLHQQRLIEMLVEVDARQTGAISLVKRAAVLDEGPDLLDQLLLGLRHSHDVPARTVLRESC